MTAALARIAVVIPVGPGDRVSPTLLAQLAQLPTEAETIVVHARDGGAAAPAAPSEPVPPSRREMHAPRGRASQQNAGASAATRDWLWFLHADSRLAATTLPALASFVQRDETALGYFDLRFLDDGPALMRLNAFGARLRSRWLGLPFGDQGLVLPRATFERLGGFDRTLGCGEDHDLVWRARRARVPLRPLGAPLYTSARKYAERGWWPTTAWHLRETWRQARRFSRARVAG
jgi:rSAM/selenodomain-associated transferase 2